MPRGEENLTIGGVPYGQDLPTYKVESVGEEVLKAMRFTPSYWKEAVKQCIKEGDTETAQQIIYSAISWGEELRREANELAIENGMTGL